MATLPIPTPEAAFQSQQLTKLIEQKIIDSGGWIDFATFMEMALYTPALGYYSNGAKKFAEVKSGGGDFVTAPQISPLFAQSLARQVAQILATIQKQNSAEKTGYTQTDILEIGAGTGQLAADLLINLSQLNQLPDHYFILEISDYLRQIQRETLQRNLPQALMRSVIWLTKLPSDFVGLILGNELLDALPTHLIVKNAQNLHERGVVFNGYFDWQDKPLTTGNLYDEVKRLEVSTNFWPDAYLTEFCLNATGLIKSLGQCLKQGAVIMLDYGFGAAEYYHSQRNAGTLMCHYQHYAHANPLILVGLQDITAHVDFTSITQAATSQGLTLAGFCNQASFLINCGILDLLAAVSPNSMGIYAPLAAAAQKLLSPAEMGDLFKAIAFTKNLKIDLIGFESGDKAHML